MKTKEEILAEVEEYIQESQQTANNFTGGDIAVLCKVAERDSLEENYVQCFQLLKDLYEATKNG